MLERFANYNLLKLFKSIHFTEHLGMRCLGIWNNCCTEDMPCPEGDGDCDSDDQCVGELRCGQNNCAAEGHLKANFTEKSDCCEDFGIIGYY